MLSQHASSFGLARITKDTSFCRRYVALCIRTRPQKSCIITLSALSEQKVQFGDISLIWSPWEKGNIRCQSAMIRTATGKVCWALSLQRCDSMMHFLLVTWYLLPGSISSQSYPRLAVRRWQLFGEIVFECTVQFLLAQTDYRYRLFNMSVILIIALLVWPCRGWHDNDTYCYCATEMFVLPLVRAYVCICRHAATKWGWYWVANTSWWCRSQATSDWPSTCSTDETVSELSMISIIIWPYILLY